MQELLVHDGSVDRHGASSFVLGGSATAGRRAKSTGAPRPAAPAVLRYPT
jgi:hypothetical protein